MREEIRVANGKLFVVPHCPICKFSFVHEIEMSTKAFAYAMDKFQEHCEKLLKKYMEDKGIQ